jgi:hypothetical protein
MIRLIALPISGSVFNPALALARFLIEDDYRKSALTFMI